MVVSSAFRFTLFALFLLSPCWAQDVTVFLNDTSLVTVPSNWWGRPDYSPLCGGSRWTNQLGQSISFTFTGTAVTVNFILEYAGAIAQVTLDGADVTQVNTFIPDEPDSACTPFPWHSGNLTQGQHTITLTQLDSGNPANPPLVYVWMRSFVYTTASDPPINSSVPLPTASVATGSTTSSGYPPIPSQSGKILPGVIAGAVGGGVVIILLLVTGLVFIRRRKKSRSRSLPRMVIDSDDYDKPRAIPPTPSRTQLLDSNSSAQGGASFDVQQRFHADVMAMMSTPAHTADTMSIISTPTQTADTMSIRSTPTQSATLSDIKSTKSWSPASSQKGTLGKSKTPLFFDPGPLPGASLSTSPHIPTTQRLTPTQLNFVQKLSEQNLPGPALATVIASLANGGKHAEPELGVNGSAGQAPSFDEEEDAPPAYYSKGA